MDDFVVRAARALHEMAPRRGATPLEVAACLKSPRTSFWSLNDVSPNAFSRAFMKRYRRLDSPADKTLELLTAFKRQVESQHRRSFGQPPKEGPGQNLLAMFFAGAGIPHRMEVPSGAGITDLFCFINGQIIETKLPRSRTEFNDGLDELAQYMRNEGTKRGYYVVFADREDPSKRRILGDEFRSHEVIHEGHTIIVVPVDIGLTWPSKIGRARRASNS